MNFVDLRSQYERIEDKIRNRIDKVFDHGQFIMGPEVFELEERFEDYLNIKHAITCANGTDALVLALMAMNIKEGDAVFCPTFTFFATAEAIATVGAQPIFVDSESKGFNISMDDLEESIYFVGKSGKFIPKAIIAVDLFGLPADYKSIRKIADKHSLHLIEDGAQSFGAKIDKATAPTFGDISTTSFFPAKPLGCYGDGGAVFTDNDEYAEKLRSLRVHGKGSDKYHNVQIGMNSRLDTLQAAILLEKLEILEDEIEARNLLSYYYNSVFAETAEIPYIPDNFKSAWAQYTILVDNRKEFTSKLNQLGIPSAVYYERCMHQQPIFKLSSKIDAKKFSRAESLASKCISIPMHIYREQLKFD